MELVLEKDFGKYIKDMFPLDQELIDKFHIEAGKGAEVCVNRTISDIEKADESFEFYVIMDTNKPVAFFGKEYTNYLNTIFVIPEYRTKEKMSIIWPLIKSKLSFPIFTALYEKNDRAINFYLKNGGTAVPFDYNGTSSVIIKLENI